MKKKKSSTHKVVSEKKKKSNIKGKKMKENNNRSSSNNPVVIDLSYNSPVSEGQFLGTPLRPVFCLKRNVGMREVEEREDCFILDFNPNSDGKSISKLVNCRDGFDDDSADLSVLAEKGQVACRDYPHSRHLCAKKPFAKTPHESFCELCYCFVCDQTAPCKLWFGSSGHCHAIDNEAWKSERKNMKKRKQ